MSSKKKSRTSLPPKTVQAPRPRAGGSREQGRDVNRNVLYGLAGSGIVALVAVVVFILVAGGSTASADAKIAPLMSKAGCTFRTVTAYVPKGQGTHVDSLTKKFPWNTDPPSNGQHYPLWAVWGFYTDPVNPRQVVHNEEHGGVILWWGTQVPESTVTALQQFYNEQPDGSFGTPYAKLGTRIAITAWTGDPAKYQLNNYYGQGHIAVCERYDAKTKVAFEAFRNAYRGHGPEGIPLSADNPGDGPSS